MFDSLIIFFLPKQAFSSERKERNALLLIKFSLISILFALGYIVNTYFTLFLVARYMMVFSVIVFGVLLVLFRHSLISLRLSVHVFVSICWFIIFVLSTFSGGIDSFVLSWITLIPVIALILISERAAWAWGGIGFLTVVFFLQFNLNEFLSASLIVRNTPILNASLHIGLQFIVLILTYIFDQQQNKLIDKIEAQNTKLQTSQEELSLKRNIVESQNLALMEAGKIIEQKNLELVSKNDELEIEIEKRTKELVEYTQQLEQFAFISSHNLRAPIARILGLGNLLELSHDPQDEAQIKKNLIVSAQELDRVVKDLNTILEIKNSNHQIAQTVRFEEELKLLLVGLEKDLSDSNTLLTFDFSESPMIKTIRPYLDSILINLISNAIKYRDFERRPEIKIQTKTSGEFICLSVSDNGIGLNLKQVQKKIFTIYSRFHTHVEGKGLGLYLVKAQAEALGGKVEVESKVGVGTTFTVYLKPKE
ncbi:MAG: sensor histidine kinase [Cyclobacteriaceae bacterium]|jgi:signal transduction histidine kinase|nr:HAMP domain-containing histidine kinase [Flammeovirgaceae bacterium]